jgi:hypothetical protein
MSKIKIAVTAALLAATSSAAFAQGGNDVSARARHHRNVQQQSAPVLQQRNVSLPTEGRSPVGPFWYSWSGPTTGGL